MDFEDYREAVSLGAVRSGPDPAALAAAAGLPADVLAATLTEVGHFARGADEAA